MARNAIRFLLCSALLCFAAAPSMAQTCSITAPARVNPNETFTLCGPTGTGLTYEWHGPGVEVDNETRCVTARVPSSGTYEFLLVLRRNGAELDRCTKVINVGGSTGGARSCAISGPKSIDAGASARLCAPNDGLHTYRWTGPNGFTATGTCVTVRDEGTYYLTSRNTVTGSTRQCTHYLDVAGATSTSCDIDGPTTIREGGTARLCAPVRSDVTYRWTGPQDFTSSTRCITAGTAGTYSVRIRDVSSGASERCTHTLTLVSDGAGEDQDPDEVVWDNCPRTLQFWRGAFAGSGSAADGLTQADLRTIARRVDERSAFFNWSNDLDGMRQALSPGGSLTRRKQVARQYAALLANVVAGELNLGVQGTESIGLDLDTRVGGTTLRSLISETDNMLRANRGNYARLNSTLTSINRGRGIGPVCE